MKKDKIKKRVRKAKSSADKEKIFIEKGTKILMFCVISFAIIFAGIKVYKSFNLEDYDDLTSGLTALTAEVDVSTIITNQLSDENKTSLIEKINASGLDILNNEEISYEKYSADSIVINNDLTLTDQEIGLLYWYLHIDNMGAYDMRIYQIEIQNIDNGYIINTVASIDFYKLFISKLDLSDDSSQLPKRVYVINSMQVVNGEFTYSNVKFNNLTEEDSVNIKSSIEQVNNVDLNKYVPSLIMAMINNISFKTNTAMQITNNCVNFNIIQGT